MLIKVTCAIIEHNYKVLITQRSAAMRMPLLWEFPGGKIEANETETDCLMREVREELGILVAPLTRLTPVQEGTILLTPYVCSWVEGSIQLTEHQAYKWVELNELQHFTWCPADVPIVEEYVRIKQAGLV